MYKNNYIKSLSEKSKNIIRRYFSKPYLDFSHFLKPGKDAFTAKIKGFLIFEHPPFNLTFKNIIQHCPYSNSFADCMIAKCESPAKY